MPRIDTGDTVFHEPTGVFWDVAFCEGDRIVLCGWPLATARHDDCTLMLKAPPTKRLAVLHELARLNDRRGEYARAELSKASDPDESAG